MKLKDNFHIFAIITIIFWASGFVFTRLALRYFSPLSLGFLRYFIASFSLFIFVCFLKIKFPQKKDLKWFILAGLFGISFYIITFNIGSTTVSASTSSLIISTSPVITTILAGIFFREKLKIVQYIAILIQLAGVIVLTLMSGVFTVNFGLIWLIIACILISVYNLLQRKLTQTYSALQTSIFSIWFGTILLLIFLPTAVTEIKEVPFIQILNILVLGVFSSAIGFVSWAYALSKSQNVSSVTNYMFLTPFLATTLGFLLAGEIPELPTIIGGGIIILGLGVFNFYNKFSSSS